MKISEMIAALQKMQVEHGDLKVMLDDVEWGYSDSVFIDKIPDDEFVAIGQSPYRGVSPFTLERVLQQCPIDHWTWDPEYVQEHHGMVLTHAGITEFNAWVEAERVKTRESVPDDTPSKVCTPQHPEQ